jgi:hypothetical protein
LFVVLSARNPLFLSVAAMTRICFTLIFYSC